MPDFSITQLTQLVVAAQIRDAATFETPQARAKFVELSNAYDNSFSDNPDDYLSFRWYATKKSVELAKIKLDSGIFDVETISEYVHQGFVRSAIEFIENPDKFDSTRMQRYNNVINNIIDCFKNLITKNFIELDENSEAKKSCLLTANTLISIYVKQEEI